MDEQPPRCPHCPHCGAQAAAEATAERAAEPAGPTVVPDPRLAALLGVLQPRAARLRSGGLRVLVVSCLLLVPWIVYLAVTLPEHYESRQWRLAWVGFDLALWTALAATAWFGWRRRQLVVPCAVVSAVLLSCDAWFDVMLSWGTGDLRVSLLSALLIELPLAGFLLVRAGRILRATFRVSWYRAGVPGEPPPLRHAGLFVDPRGIAARDD